MPKAIEISNFLINEKIIKNYNIIHTIDLNIKIATDNEATAGDLSWIPYSPSNEYLNNFNGSMLICLLPSYTKFDSHLGYIRRTIIIQCENPKLAMAMVLNKFFVLDSEYYRNIILLKESAIIHTEYGKNVSIGPNCCIGIAGQGYAKNGDKYVHFPHLGKVIIEDNVSIGANTVICRGTIGNTIVMEGTKIGNLVNIGHNVKIGKNVMVIAGATICGGVEIGDNAWIGPSATILNKVKIGEGSQVGMGSVVTKDVPHNSTVVGNPARKIK